MLSPACQQHVNQGLAGAVQFQAGPVLRSMLCCCSCPLHRDIIETEDAVSLDVTWSPAAGMYMARVWHETESDTLGEARNSWMQADSQWLAEVGQVNGCTPAHKGNVCFSILGVTQARSGIKKAVFSTAKHLFTF
jgi:hypothetical protein